ncbi:hypothetical protein [Neorhizobium sp. T7_12]|uniref:hypothetical protein n=1 Tax=Neorhizobium sp. T7_12 TaxID=2093832 RepID=UPI000CFA4D7F|nr:hypothetical protein [Neorhizobium sp. T7_12]
MTDWLEGVNRQLRLAGQKDATTLRGLKEIIFGLWSVMQASDATIRDYFRSYPEGDLVKAASVLDLAGCLAEITAPADNARATRAVFKDLAARLRALENLFYAEHNGATAKNSAAYEVEFDGRRGYFLDWAPKNRTPGEKGTFAKRALARSRILPRAIGNAEVKIHVLDDPRGALRASAGATKLHFGAGLFQDLKFQMQYNDDGFIVDGVTCAGQAQTIGNQLVAATQAGCSGVVYPELTITGDVLEGICATIAGGELPIELSLVVAGSRHKKCADGLTRNTATVVDGYGEPKVEQNKFFRYSEGPKPSESIEPGTELSIVVLADAVLACAICLDFCHRTEHPPYDDLDVDLIVVPSCGEVVTMDSHLRKAQDIHLNRKVNTLVVQQFHDGQEPKDADPLGYILAPHALQAAAASELGTREPWSIVAV